MSPKGEHWDLAVEQWKDLVSDDDAVFDKVVVLDAADIAPQVTWGSSPELVGAITDRIPDPADEPDETRRKSLERALQYMGLEAGTPIKNIPVDKVFIGSCTNSRIEDLRAAAEVAKGHKVSSEIKLAMVVPGSGLVQKQAEE